MCCCVILLRSLQLKNKIVTRVLEKHSCRDKRACECLKCKYIKLVMCKYKLSDGTHHKDVTTMLSTVTWVGEAWDRLYYARGRSSVGNGLWEGWRRRRDEWGRNPDGKRRQGERGHAGQRSSDGCHGRHAWVKNRAKRQDDAVCTHSEGGRTIITIYELI